MENSKLPALLLVAHGSRLQASNEEVKSMTKALTQRLHHRFSFISCAFLELAKPSIPEGIEACADYGASKTLILPYFLSSGAHVARDIPAIVEEKRKQHPQMRIELGDYCGRSKKMIELLSDMALSCE